MPMHSSDVQGKVWWCDLSYLVIYIDVHQFHPSTNKSFVSGIVHCITVQPWIGYTMILSFTGAFKISFVLISHIYLVGVAIMVMW